MTVAGPNLMWLITIQKSRPQLSVSPTHVPENGFWISLIRQYVHGHEDIQYLSASDEIAWARENIDQIEQLFSNPSNLESTCDQLRTLLRSNGEKQWGPPASGEPS